MADGSLVQFLVMIAVIFAVFYFIVFRPEKKRREQLQDKVNNLKPGDKVVTIGGIRGTVTGVTDESVVLRVSEQTKIEFTKQAVGTVVSPEAETNKAE